MDSDFWTKMIMGIIVLHFVAGFIYLMIKLSPTKEDKRKQKQQEEERD